MIESKLQLVTWFEDVIRRMQRGYFITLEGGEGAGKSTQAKLIMEFLAAQNISAILTREPGGSVGAEEIRSLLVQGGAQRWDPISEYLLFSAARRDHLLHTVWPALEKGQWVICDRFYDSSRAYQGSGHGLNMSFIESVYQEVSGGFSPDLTFIFDLDVQLGIERALQRRGGEDRFEQLDLAFHKRVRNSFLNMAQDEPQRFQIIDASQSVEDIAHVIQQHLISKLFAQNSALS